MNVNNLNNEKESYSRFVELVNKLSLLSLGADINHKLKNNIKKIITSGKNYIYTFGTKQVEINKETYFIDKSYDIDFNIKHISQEKQKY
jgi:hypothetical protein